MLLPEYIREQLRAAGRRAFDARTQPLYAGPAYQQAIQEIDEITESARQQFPKLFKTETQEDQTRKTF